MYKSNLNIKKENLNRFLNKDIEFELDIDPNNKYVYKKNEVKLEESKPNNIKEDKYLKIISNSKA